MCLQLGFVIFCQKELCTKLVCKLLVILTIGVNFNNILTSRFLYKSALHTFYVLIVWVCNFLWKGNKFSKKAARKMLAKLTLEVRGRVRTNRRRHRRESDAKISGSDAKANRMPVFEHFPVQVPIKRTLALCV